jgi:hypothetical protein
LTIKLGDSVNKFLFLASLELPAKFSAVLGSDLSRDKPYDKTMLLACGGLEKEFIN